MRHRVTGSSSHSRAVGIRERPRKWRRGNQAKILRGSGGLVFPTLAPLVVDVGPDVKPDRIYVVPKIFKWSGTIEFVFYE